jgi:hypothetical protein
VLIACVCLCGAPRLTMMHVVHMLSEITVRHWCTHTLTPLNVCRHFWWHTLMLWPWELPDPSVLVLSGKDSLVPSELVRAQLENAPAHVHVLERPDLYHGHFLFKPAWQAVIVARFKAAVLAREAADAAAAAAAAAAHASAGAAS